AEDGIRDDLVTGVQTCALPICERGDFERFARLTTGHRRLAARALGELEPSLEGRFRDGLFYADEGHVEPRRVLPQLHARIAAARSEERRVGNGCSTAAWT